MSPTVSRQVLSVPAGIGAVSVTEAEVYALTKISSGLVSMPQSAAYSASVDFTSTCAALANTNVLLTVKARPA